MNYMKTQMKSDLWDIFYKAQADGVGREVTNAIIDIMILMDRETDEAESEVAGRHYKGQSPIWYMLVIPTLRLMGLIRRVGLL